MAPWLRWMPVPSLLVAAALAALTALYVDLTPRVDERFFFSADSPAYREARAIERMFVGQQLLVVTAHAPDITTREYRQRVEALTEKLRRLRRVHNVSSLAAGPDGLEDVRESPLWRRLLLLPGAPATNLVLTVDDSDPRKLIEPVLRVLRASERPDFRLSLAGVPYVVDSIARNLKQDFRTFSLAAVGVFAVLMAVLFRSWAVLLGGLTACTAASLLTLLVQGALGGRIGLLTANLVTIAFVLTQSHIVFLTHNYRQERARHDSDAAALRCALRDTLQASAWCMVTTLLGFASLLAVAAQPLRELGHGGVLATLAAILCAYLVYPPFLLWGGPRPPP
jgi:uncharacterized protein